MSNFKFPFFSRDITELWKKWHISMSSWFRDYLYMPILLRLRDYKMLGLILSTFLTYGIIGFWHGANYTFIFFGITQAFLFLPAIISKRKPFKTQIFRSKNMKTTIVEVIMCIKTLLLFSLSLCFFRSGSIFDAISYLLNIIKYFEAPSTHLSGLLYIFLILILDYLLRNDPRLEFNSSSKYINFIFCILGILAVMLFAPKSSSSFIYFQF